MTVPRFVSSETKAEYRLVRNDGLYTIIGDFRQRFYALSRKDIVPVPKSPDGWRNPSSYWSYVERDNMPHGRWQRSDGPYGLTSYGNHGQAVFDTVARQAPDINVGLRSRAEVQALLSLKDQQVNLSQAFAERAQTARLVGDSLMRIANAAISVKKGLIKGAAEILGVGGHKRSRRLPARSNWRDPVKNMGAFWLELQYGWRPLLSDIHGVALQLDKNYPPSSYRIRVKGKAKETSEFLDSQAFPGYCPVQYVCKDHTECRVRLFYTPDVPALAAIGSAGLSNPAYIAWELVPFSFIADWAIPIGDWLNALDADNGFIFRGGDRTEYRSRVSTVHGNRLNDVYWSDLSGFHERTRSDRTVYHDAPFAELPSFKNPWSLTHAANSAALLSTVLKGTGGGSRVR